MQQLFLSFIILTSLFHIIECSSNNQNTCTTRIEYSVTIGKNRILCNNKKEAKKIASQTSGKIEKEEIWTAKK